MSEAPSPGRDCERISLILAGHGSHRSGASAAPVFEVAERIRATGEFREVIEAFWKEEPSLAEALDLVSGDGVVVVPLFLAEGYFTRVVVPRELQARPRRARPVALASPVGAHARMAEMILRRADEAVPADEAGDWNLLVIGHGTDRSATSGRTLERTRAALRCDGGFREVRVAFLDQEPRPGKVIRELGEGPVVIVPFFLSEGWHAGTTLPDELGIASGRKGSRVRYTAPVGTLPQLAVVVRELAREAAAALRSGDGSPSSAPDEGRVAAAHRSLHAWIRSGGSAGRAFLQLRLRARGGEPVEIVHEEDAHLPPAALRPLSSGADLRRMARTTADGGHRPLRSAPDLQRGWRARAAGPLELSRMMDAVYPGAVLAWHLARSGAPGAAPIPFAHTAGRQTGHHAGVRALAGERLRQTVRDVCLTSCLRSPAWHPAAAAEETGPEGVPCPEACSFFLASARERATEAPVPESPIGEAVLTGVTPATLHRTR